MPRVKKTNQNTQTIQQQTIQATQATQQTTQNDENEIILKRMEREKCNGGELHISLIWNDIADLDLHVICPSGDHLYYGNTQTRCGGWLDKDMNRGGEASLEPIENVFWASSPSGHYKVYVHNFNNKTDTNTVFTDHKRKVSFRVRMKNNDTVKWFDGSVGPNESQTCFEFDHTGSGALGSFAILPSYDKPMTFEEICKDNQVEYIHGSGYYCVLKKESISEKKDMILYNTENDTFIIGSAECRKELCLADNGSLEIKPTDIPEKYKLYVQSTSHNRKIPKDTKTLMTVSVRNALKLRRKDDYKL